MKGSLITKLYSLSMRRSQRSLLSRNWGHLHQCCIISSGRACLFASRNTKEKVEWEVWSFAVTSSRHWLVFSYVNILSLWSRMYFSSVPMQFHCVECTGPHHNAVIQVKCTEQQCESKVMEKKAGKKTEKKPEGFYAAECLNCVGLQGHGPSSSPPSASMTLQTGKPSSRDAQLYSTNPKLT